MLVKPAPSRITLASVAGMPTTLGMLTILAAGVGDGDGVTAVTEGEGEGREVPAVEVAATEVATVGDGVGCALLGPSLRHHVMYENPAHSSASRISSRRSSSIQRLRPSFCSPGSAGGGAAGGV